MRQSQEERQEEERRNGEEMADSHVEQRIRKNG